MSTKIQSCFVMGKENVMMNSQMVFDTMPIIEVFMKMTFNPSPKYKILDFSKLKEFSDKYCKFDEIGGKFS